MLVHAALEGQGWPAPNTHPKSPSHPAGLRPLKGVPSAIPSALCHPVFPSCWLAPLPVSPLPHIVMLLNVNLVEHHILLLGIDVCFHLHGNVAGKDRQQKPLLGTKYMSSHLLLPLPVSVLLPQPVALQQGPGRPLGFS